jgi:hypothetical protein
LAYEHTRAAKVTQVATVKAEKLLEARDRHEKRLYDRLEIKQKQQ